LLAVYYKAKTCQHIYYFLLCLEAYYIFCHSPSISALGNCLVCLLIKLAALIKKLCAITFCCYFFQHISWLWYPCPNHYSSDDGILIADGTTVSNASLYGVRITGESGVFISELHVLQNPLQPGIAGLYRCEAWPHGASRNSMNHQASLTYHDEFIIGGHLMVKSCFYDPHRHKYYHQHYGSTTYNHKFQKSYQTPRNEAVPDVTANMMDDYSEVNKTRVS
jgi:hypothetical protein